MGDQIVIDEDGLEDVCRDLSDATEAAATGDRNKCASKAADAKQKVLDIREEADVLEVTDAVDDEEPTPQEVWEQHNRSFDYEPPEKPADAWSSEEYQELYDRMIQRRTEWICGKCTGRGPIGSLEKARSHVERQHGSDLVEEYATPREELEAATDGGPSEDSSEPRGEENRSLGDFA